MDSTSPGSRRPPTSQTSPHIAKGPILQPTSSHVKTLRLVRWRSRAFRMLLWPSSISSRRRMALGIMWWVIIHLRMLMGIIRVLFASSRVRLELLHRKWIFRTIILHANGRFVALFVFDDHNYLHFDLHNFTILLFNPII